MKTKSSIFLLAQNPVFNTASVPVFESLDSEHSALLWQALFLNAFEVLGSYNSTPFYAVVDENDRNFFPEKLLIHKDKIIFGNFQEQEILFRNLNDRYFRENENNVIVLSNAIGYTHNDLSRTFNLLNTNDDCLVIARSIGDKLCFAGFNTYPEFLESRNLDYDNILRQACRYNSLLYTIENFIYLNNAGDFRLLYQGLSKKESLAYCSQEMHELFTHLFIEYKDLLK